MHDVLIVGGGLAGTLAALTAQQAGASVLLASRSWGATALCSGALDLAFTPALSPNLQAAARPLTEHVVDIINHRPRHPYGVLGPAATQKALAGGYASLQRAVAGSGLDLEDLDLGGTNLAMASSLGTLMPTGSLFAPHRGLRFDQGGRFGVVSFLGDGQFVAERLCRGFAYDAGRRFAQPATFVAVPVRLEAKSSLSLARAFDDAAMQQQLVLELHGKLDGLDGLILPPVLGIERVAAAHQRLREQLGLPIVEALAHLPSVPGVRLQRALDAALAVAGVDRLGEIATSHAAAAQSFDGFGGAGQVPCLPTVHEVGGQPISAKSIVLATGRFIAGGVGWNRLSCEQLFGLPLVTELGPLEADSPHSVVRRAPVESHPLMTAGVQVNASMQVIRRGKLAHPNLFAAGMVIGGFASRYALCADGVALCSGHLAGLQAAAAAQRAVAA
jgi:glycerol-3-phosphate dehydrogenase subunit B